MHIHRHSPRTTTTISSAVMDEISSTQTQSTVTVFNLSNVASDDISRTHVDPTAATAMPPPILSMWRGERTGQTFDALMDNFYGPSPAGDGSVTADNLGPFRVLIPVSIVGWVLFGAGCILCINGKGQSGRWVPEWYLDSNGTRQDRALVAAWWLSVLLLWPVILPALLVGKVVRAVRKALNKRAKRRQRKAQQDEESRMNKIADLETTQ